MNTLSQLYGHSLALLTDLYQLTMAYSYWKTGLARRQAVFHLSFRKAPFGSQFAVACGLAYAVDFLKSFHYTAEDLVHLQTLRGADDQPLFEEAFLQDLGDMQFRCDVDALPEGTLVFPHEPLVRVTGPLWQAQLLETPLLTLINFQTLAATKAARICQEAGGEAVLEFGLRRAQGIDGGISASRAAVVGGCSATSNVLAGKLFGIPVKGTHAHSWVMTFDSELESFRAYAAAMPNNVVLLVDTYDTVRGVQHAITVGRELKQQGRNLLGIRLDSGDLTELSKTARRLLDDAGFQETAIIASNDLDEYLIRDLHQQGAKINVWGVGTKLATAFDQPALGGVYKLSALQNEQCEWEHKIKLSEQTIKISTPGKLQVRRYADEAHFLGDVIYDELEGIESPVQAVGGDSSVRQYEGEFRDLLIPVVRQGEVVYSAPGVHEAREHAQHQLALLPPAMRRLQNPSPYPVGLERNLQQRKTAMIQAARRKETP